MSRLGHSVDRLILSLSYAGAALGVVSVVAMTLLVFLNVVLRQFLSRPFLFVEEYTSYLYMVIVYMGFAYATRVDAHITVDFVAKRLPRRVRNGLEVMNSSLALIAFGVYFWYLWRYLGDSIRGGWKAETIFETPLWIPVTIMMIGLVVFCLEIAARIVKQCAALRR